MFSVIKTLRTLIKIHENLKEFYLTHHNTAIDHLSSLPAVHRTLPLNPETGMIYGEVTSMCVHGDL